MRLRFMVCSPEELNQNSHENTESIYPSRFHLKLVDSKYSDGKSNIFCSFLIVWITIGYLAFLI